MKLKLIPLLLLPALMLLVACGGATEPTPAATPLPTPTPEIVVKEVPVEVVKEVLVEDQAKLHDKADKFLDSGKHELAIKEYTTIIGLNPEDEYAYQRRGYLYDRIGEYRKAIRDFDTAIGLNSDDPWTYQMRGWAYADLEEDSRAIEDYGKAIGLDPDYIFAYQYRGYSYDRIGEYRKAIRDFDTAIGLNSDDPLTYRARGSAYKHLGKYELAKADFGKACSINNEHCSDIPFRFPPTSIPTSSPDPNRGVIAEVVTAGEILSEFRSNGVVALAKYTDQTFKVTGVIEVIDYDYYDNPYVQFRGGEYSFRSVRCMIIDDLQIRNIAAGDEITLEGTFAEWDSPTIYLISCSVVSD